MYKIAEIAVEKTAYEFDLPFTYFIPTMLEKHAQIGLRVIVPFGRSNAKRQGIILNITDGETIDSLKPIISITDSQPLITQEMIYLIKHLKQTTFCTYYTAFKQMIPIGLSVNIKKNLVLNKDNIEQDLTDRQKQMVDYLLSKKNPVDYEKFKKELKLLDTDKSFNSLIDNNIIVVKQDLRQKISDEKLTMVKVTDKYSKTDLESMRFGEKQKKVIELLLDAQIVSLKEIKYFANATKATVDTLVKKEIVEYFYKDVFRIPKNIKEKEDNNVIELTDDQKRVYNSIKSDMDNGKYGINLIHGVTGSGKTQIYIKLIHHALKMGKTAIMLVPEISLTPQTIDVFCSEFGENVALLHSGLSLSERMDEWKRIKEGKARVVVGTRSATFAPIENLGVFIIDEEQEGTYKSDSSPRFHSREVAKIRCRYNNAQLVLASATPSVDSYYNAQIGKYKLYKIDKRFKGQPLPHVHIEDMSNEHNPNKVFSEKLLTEIQYNLAHEEQTILLLNRRGYNTVIKCSSCGEVATCPNCSVSLTYHRANGMIICHQCGYERELIKNCEKCGSSYIGYKGIGTQFAQEKLKNIFPDSRILRMDMDTTMSKYSYETKFNDFANGEYDIMIGTQMVAKGHDFPNVTLVGVLNSDSSLYADDFRSCEKTFSLITQVIGRSGRHDKIGRAIIQTTSPRNDVILDASVQNYEKFYKTEIETRKLCIYPPFCDICMIGITSPNSEHAKNGAYIFANIFINLAKKEYKNLPVRLLGPCEPKIYKVNNKFRYKILVKCRNTKNMRELLSRSIKEFYKNKLSKDVKAYIDMYYDSQM